MTSLPRPNSLLNPPHPKRTLHVDLAHALNTEPPEEQGSPVSASGLDTSKAPVEISPGPLQASVEGGLNAESVERGENGKDTDESNQNWPATSVADGNCDEIIIQKDDGGPNAASEKQPFSMYEAQLERAARQKFHAIMESYVAGTTFELDLPDQEENAVALSKSVTKKHLNPSPPRNQKSRPVHRATKANGSDEGTVNPVSGLRGQTLAKHASKQIVRQTSDGQRASPDAKSQLENDTVTICNDESVVDIGIKLQFHERDSNNNDGLVDDVASQGDAVIEDVLVTTNDLLAEEVDTLSTVCERQSVVDHTEVNDILEEIEEEETPTENQPAGGGGENSSDTGKFAKRRRPVIRDPVRARKLPPGRVVECSVATVTEYDVDGEYRYMLGKALDTYSKYKRQEVLGEKALSLEAAIKGLQERKGNAFPTRPLTPRVTRERRHRVKSAPPLAVIPRSGVTVQLSPKFPEPEVLPGDVILRVGLANSRSVDRARQRPVSAAYPASVMSRSMDDKLHNKLFTPRPTMFEKSSNRPVSTSSCSKQQRQQIRKALLEGTSGRASAQADKDHNFCYKGGFFSANSSPRKGHFTIHPEWVSENFNVKKLSLNDNSGKYATYPPRRRCKSAPPPARRNPITWQ